MKLFRKYAVIALSLLMLASCEKEYSLENAVGTAVGSLKSDAFGDCLPSSVAGIYKADSTLGTGNYMDVQLELTTGGAYTIVTDTINGYYFKGTGAAAAGLQTVRLRGFGKPVAAGINEFRIAFGTSECFLSVTVLNNAATVSDYTLVGSPGVCTGAVASGTYVKDVPLNSSNTLTVSVNVTSLGLYAIGGASANGMIFTAAGTFTTLGLQSVTLNGSGTPSSAGATAVTVGGPAGTCLFGIVVAPTAGTPAVFTLGGDPGNCTGFVLSGTYQVGQATSGSNTATFDVVVTTPGTYVISSASINGVTFLATGTFATAGTQPVTLTAFGTPIAAGTFEYTPMGLGSGCKFPVVFN
ncbi:MAG: hypothetical protein EOO03_00015 [Chitinophagaceae bacterium]|nr:MAG: hypothetical protein EOO03_00015 [Chitinophagaceae bacterium]